MNAWHADPRDLRAWVDGDAGLALGASIEQHLIGCPQCRMAIAGLVDERPPVHDAVDAGWEGLLASVQSPPLGPVHRLLARVGVPVADLHAARSATTPRIVWLLGTILTLGFVVMATVFSTGDGGAESFLAVAPLVPVAGVALLCGPRTDPAHELLVAAPYPLIRLVLLRTLVVLATSVPALLITGLLLPLPSRVATLWLLPCAGFIVAVLASATWIEIERAATGAAVLWIAAVVVGTRRGAFDHLLGAAAIETYVALIVGAGLVLLYRARAPRSAIRLR
ncbi:hypothetical protein [Flexivirga oryzae]|uniref:Zf-HC2 domain-containing protein n=1 Tax=Flexivirga oryzae TaxID=1794944 RepID=A0A839N7N2_9MICO|nr:hypothetical protein [Flexivirga oryzae]MBB2890672.1 hypothetical protein [Flexivirga oryzae]